MGVIVVIVVSALGYLAYREWGVSRVQQLHFVDDYSGIPPVQCVGRSSGFAGYDVGTTSFAHGLIRSDATAHGKDGISHLHMLVTKDKTFYMWNDESTDGTLLRVSKKVGPVDQKIANIIDLPVFVHSVCAPWVGVDESLFQMPRDVTFTDISQ